MGPSIGIADGNTGWASGAHSGNQYAYISVPAGQVVAMRQTVTGLEIGKLYSVRYWQGRQGLSYNTAAAAVAVWIDGEEVSGGGISTLETWSEHETPPFRATATSHQLEFRAFYWNRFTGSGAVLDDVSIVETTDSLNDLNGSFEAPIIPVSQWRYGSTGAGTRWRFAGQYSGGYGAGIATKDSTWTTTAGDGNQIAYVQADGYMERILRGLQYGQPYTVQFLMNRRPVTSPGIVDVLLNNVPLMTGLSPQGPIQWNAHESPVFVPSAATAALRFQGLITGGDTSVLFDAVRILPIGFVDFTIAPSGIICGNIATGHVTISRAAPPGGATIELQSSDPLLKVPSTVTIPAGEVTTSFQFTTGVTAVASMKQVRARFGMLQKTRNLWVYPAELSSLTVTPGSIVGGNTAVGRVTTNGTASSNYFVTLTSSGPQLVVPANVKVLFNTRSADFEVSSIPVSVTYTRFVTATRGTRSRTATVLITP